MMFGMPSAPFTMTWPKLGTENPEVLSSLKMYSAAKYGRPRKEIEAEIDKRLAASNSKQMSVHEKSSEDRDTIGEEIREENAQGRAEKVYRKHDSVEREENFLEAWMRKRAEISKNDSV